MIDLMKKTLLTGIGFACMTREKIEQFAKTLAEQGEVSEKEGKKLVDELLQKHDEAKEDLETRVKSIVTGLMEKMNLATKADISRLEKLIKESETKAGEK
ncbi:MAG: polyhydroxyalkanoate synthesis regulator [Deltaproteobacteria bacterium]|nr:polyhydroxyalkanoate synthesis regulator [Deltaproteobacteria bacterium]